MTAEKMLAVSVRGAQDRNWEECCRDVALQWNLHLRPYGAAIKDGFAGTLQPAIRGGISESLEMARAAGQRPALSETTDKIGKSAILLLRLLPLPQFTLPLFVAMAVGHLYAYFIGLLHDQVPDIQGAVSARLALLGNRIGAELESEIRGAVGGLHQWQEQALRNAAEEQATNSVGIF